MCREQASCRSEGLAQDGVCWTLGWGLGQKGRDSGLLPRLAWGCAGCTPGCPDAVVWDGGVSRCCSTSSASSGFELAWLGLQGWVSGESGQCGACMDFTVGAQGMPALTDRQEMPDPAWNLPV